MYQIESFRGKGFFGKKGPIENANEWLRKKGNSIKVISTNTVFDDDGKLLEVLITYECEMFSDVVDTTKKAAK